MLGIENVESFARLESMLLDKGAQAQLGNVVIRLLVEFAHVVLANVEMSFEGVVVDLGEGLDKGISFVDEECLELRHSRADFSWHIRNEDQ